MNVGTDLDRVGATHPNGIALIDPRRDDEVVHYEQLLRRTRRMSAALAAHGVVAGDRVALLAGNTFDHIVAWYAVLRLGAIVVDVNYLLGSSGQAHVLADADARVVVAEPGLLASGAAPGSTLVVAPDAWRATSDERGAAAASARDPAVIAYTSGTTGRPKGVVHTHGAVDAQLELLLSVCGFASSWSTYVAVPLFALHGFLPQVAAPLRVGGTVILDDKFVAPRFAAASRRHAIHYTTFSSPMLPSLLELAGEERPDLSHIEVLTCGGAPLHPDLRRAFEETFGVHVTQGYSCTEVLGAFVMDIAGNAPEGAAGPVFPGRAGVVRVVDDDGAPVPPGELGEIQFHRTVTMREYWRQPAATADAFGDGDWYATGDVGSIDEAGFLRIVDRKRDVILRGGFNVYSAEVERSLLEHDAVVEVAVVGRADDRLGEVPVAFVVVVPAAVVTAEELRAHVRKREGPLREPAEVHFVGRDDLPRNDLGKVQKSTLRSQLA